MSDQTPGLLYATYLLVPGPVRYVLQHRPHPTPPSLKLLLRAKKRQTLSFLISTLTVPTNLPTYLPKGRQLVSRKKDLRTRRRVLCVD